jgi:hypothetical protein
VVRGAAAPIIRHDQTVRVPDPLESLLVIVTVAALSLGLVKGPGCRVLPRQALSSCPGDQALERG